MPRITHAEAIGAISSAIQTAEPLAAPHEIRMIERTCDGLAEEVKFMARIDDDSLVHSDALIEGLKELSLQADNGIVYDGDKLSWGKYDQDFVLLFFTVDMMKKCGGY